MNFNSNTCRRNAPFGRKNVRKNALSESKPFGQKKKPRRSPCKPTVSVTQYDVHPFAFNRDCLRIVRKAKFRVRSVIYEYSKEVVVKFDPYIDTNFAVIRKSQITQSV